MPNAPGACPGNPPIITSTGSGRQPLGQTCAPPVNSTCYWRDGAVIGAFATDMQLSLVEAACRTNNQLPCSRVFTPVRGDASITWADVVVDDPTVAPPPPPKPWSSALQQCGTVPFAKYPPFSLDCGVRDSDGRCDGLHHAGVNPNEPGNSRGLTTPGEPFGMAQTDDGSAILLTAQTETETSVFTTGLVSPTPALTPALQFIVDTVPNGGIGVTSIPHDPLAFPDCDLLTGANCPPRPAFLETFSAAAEIDLIRYYSDNGFILATLPPVPDGGVPDGGLPEAGPPDAGPLVPIVSSVQRPFITREAVFPLTANASGTNSRGIVIDPTPRMACKAAVDPTAPDAAAQITACAQKPARVFIANRTPSSLIIGEIGEPSLSGDGTYDADRLVINKTLPLSDGASRLYLAPIIDANGNYALRLFIVCFDADQIFVYDPDAQQMENVIHTGLGPYAMAFDPFSLEDVATRAKAPTVDPRNPDTNVPPLGFKPYRFAYIASFTESYVQLLDLDNSRTDKSTFETIVFTLGLPVAPKGTQ